MRVLYLSRADQFDDRSSLVIIAKSVFKYMLESDPEMYVTWVVPRGVKDEVLDQYLRMPLGENAKRLQFLKAMPGLAGRTLGYMMTEDVWYQLTQTKVTVPYDVVLSNQMALTPIWHTVLTNRYMNGRYAVKVPIVNWQMWTATTQQLREVPEYYAGEPDVVAESVASMFATNVWESEVLYKAHLDTMREYVKPHVIRKVMSDSVVLANGVDYPALERIYEERVERLEDGPRRLFWAGRLSNQKKPRITFPLMEKVRQASRSEAPIVSTNRPESDDDVAWARAQFPDWQIYTKVNRARFHELMAGGDVFICNSPSESYGVAWLEMLAAGMLGVFERAWWNESLLPEWYPFVVDTHQEQVEMATALMKSDSLWEEYVPRVREWIREEHNESRTGERLGELLRRKKAEAMEADAGKARGSMGELVERAAELAQQEYDGPVPQEAVWAKMHELSDANRDWGKPGDVVTRMFLRRCLEGRGWRDICQGPQVEFVKGAQDV